MLRRPHRTFQYASSLLAFFLAHKEKSSKIYSVSYFIVIPQQDVAYKNHSMHLLVVKEKSPCFVGDFSDPSLLDSTRLELAFPG